RFHAARRGLHEHAVWGARRRRRSLSVSGTRIVVTRGPRAAVQEVWITRAIGRERRHTRPAAKRGARRKARRRLFRLSGDARDWFSGSRAPGYRRLGFHGGDRRALGRDPEADLRSVRVAGHLS